MAQFRLNFPESGDQARIKVLTVLFCYVFFLKRFRPRQEKGKNESEINKDVL